MQAYSFFFLNDTKKAPKENDELLTLWKRLWNSIYERVDATRPHHRHYKDIFNGFKDGIRNKPLNDLYAFITKPKKVYPDIGAIVTELGVAKNYYKFTEADLSYFKSIAAEISRKELKMKRRAEMTKANTISRDVRIKMKEAMSAVQEIQRREKLKRIKDKLVAAGIEIKDGIVNRQQALSVLKPKS